MIAGRGRRRQTRPPISDHYEGAARLTDDEWTNQERFSPPQSASYGQIPRRLGDAHCHFNDDILLRRD
ncbi:hypothetical protein E2C01_026675 [Portunus trituberculatus]|uniref:Uncharacterized protein n=1 Tax=Portunus trituberculatus TaxID=210409 RepID=A0A5B7EFY3_PORTR|nr:hypothetical protein [Portunus trituberculatus]